MTALKNIHYFEHLVVKNSLKVDQLLKPLASDLILYSFLPPDPTPDRCILMSLSILV